MHTNKASKSHLICGKAAPQMHTWKKVPLSYSYEGKMDKGSHNHAVLSVESDQIRAREKNNLFKLYTALVSSELTSAACYQLVQFPLKMGFALAKRWERVRWAGMTCCTHGSCLGWT